MLKRKLFALIFAACAMLFWIGSADAEVSPGVRVGAYFDAESAFVGGEVLLGITENWSMVPNVEYVFIDNGDLLTLNFDFQYHIRTSHRPEFWAGAGPALIFFDPENPNADGDTDFGVNLFLGVGFPLRESRLLPYVQSKLILADDSEFSVGFGIRF